MLGTDDPELLELMAEARAARRYQSMFCAHPDPRDPDHPEDDNETPDTTD